MKNHTIPVPLLIRVPAEYREVLQCLRKQTHVPYIEIIRLALQHYLPKVMPSPDGLGFIEKEQQDDPDTYKDSSQFSEQAMILARKLRDLILINTPDARMPTEAQIRKWAREIDCLNRLDGKSWEQIEWLLVWSQQDHFWRQNIHSGGKFRKQWNQLLAKAQAEQPQYSPGMPEEELMREDDLRRLMREA